jgi:HAD superfamily hydrolase (TIGR01509 family)
VHAREHILAMAEDSAGGTAVPAIAAAIFDFDGTLVDTMPLHYEAYRRVLAEVGIVLEPRDFFDNIGGNARETIPKFLRGRPCPLSPAEIHAEKKRVVNRMFEEAEIPVLETAKLLPVLAQHMPLALVSSGSRPGIEIILTRLDWNRHFQTVITGEDATRGKPAPDLFLLAAERLHVRPDSCLVFEDTDAGVEAGLAAGMRVFDVRRAQAAAPPGVEPGGTP